MSELSGLPQLRDSSLKAYYKLESGSDLLTDSGPNGYTLTNNNSVASAAGIYGFGADFGTANTNKTLRVSSAMGISNGVISVSFWVKLNTEIAANTYRFIEHSQDTTKVLTQIQYEYNAGTRRLVLSRNVANVATYSVVTNTTLGTTDWHHIVYSFDGTNINGYLDGATLTPVASSGTGSGTFPNNFTIGGTRADAANFFASAIVDDVGVTSRVITTGEVAMLNQKQGNFIYL